MNKKYLLIGLGITGGLILVGLLVCIGLVFLVLPARSTIENNREIISESSVTSTRSTTSFSRNGFTDTNDERIKMDVITFADAIGLYVIDNVGNLPKLNDGSDLPTVTNENIMEQGADLEGISQEIVPYYVSNIVVHPNGEQYKIGVTVEGELIVAGRLSDGSIFTSTQ